MFVYLLLVLLILISTAIAALLLVVGSAMLATPNVLFTVHQKTIAVLCIVAGAILLIPLLLGVLIGIGDILIRIKKKINKQ